MKIVSMALVSIFMLSLLGFNISAWGSAASELAKQNRERKAKEAASERKDNIQSRASYVALMPEIYTQYPRKKSRQGYIRVAVHFKLNNEGAVHTVKKHSTVIKNTFLELIAQQPADALRTIKGREKLRGQAKRAVQKVMNEITGEPIVDEVYFTKYLAN